MTKRGVKKKPTDKEKRKKLSSKRERIKNLLRKIFFFLGRAGNEV